MAYGNHNWSMQIIKTKTYDMSRHVIGQCKFPKEKHMASKIHDWSMQE